MNDIAPITDSILTARRGGPSAPAPALPDAASAYAVQQAVAQALGYAASRYWKSGGPSREPEPTHARLPHDGVVNSPADLRAFAFRLRGVEAEIALRLAAPVDAARAEGLSVEAARGLVDAMTVSIEIVDSRWSEALQAPALAKLADLQSHGALVLGSWKPLDSSRDWMRQACTVKVGDQAPQVFTGTHSMGDPAQVLPRWLRHATQGGRVVPAGTVVTTGTWCGILMAQAGDLVQVSFEGVGEASVQL